MFIRARRPASWRTGRNLLVVFALTILLPGILLAVFAARALVHERRFSEQQLRERLDGAADGAVRDLERELREWQGALDRLDRLAIPEPETLPQRLREAIAEPGAGAIVLPGGSDTRVWPTSQLLYSIRAGLSELPSFERADAALAEAEMAEVRDKQYLRAVDLYQRLLPGAHARQRALVLHRLARTYRKAGLHDEALRAFSALAKSSEYVGVLPADLVARYEIAAHWAARDARDALRANALDFYRELVGGRWHIEKPRYVFYAAAARDWLRQSGTAPEDLARLTSVEESKRAFTEAISDLTAGRPSASHLLFIQGEASKDGGAAFVLSKEWLGRAVWPRTFATILAAGFDVSLSERSGDVLFQSNGGPAQGTPLHARALHDVSVPWRFQIWPRDPAALSADLARRQRLYFVMLVLVVALLAFGTSITVRVVRKELEIAQLKSDFVSTVSHEFRTPLTGIRQLGEMLLDGRVPSEERRRQYYERITRESDRLTRLVENLLDFARMEEGRKQYRFEPLEPAAWLRAVAAEFQTHLPEGRASLVATIPGALPPVMADREALSCAVHNLLDNAVKYSPCASTVWLDAEAVNTHVTIRVRDRGIGILHEDRTRIFDKFYRGGAAISREVKGAGLGLSLVRHIIHAHGGTIDVDSLPGEGTTFSIHLDAAGTT